MKKLVALFLCAVLLLSVGCASASTFDYSFSSLKSIVESSTSLSTTTYTTSSGSERIVVFYKNDSELLAWAEIFYASNSPKIISYLLFTGDSTAVSSSRLNSALTSVNNWNFDKRYPTAILRTDDNTFMANYYLMGTSDLTTGVVQEFIEDVISGGKQFINFLHDEGWLSFSVN